MVLFPEIAEFCEVHLYDDVSWVESWCMSASTLASVRAALAACITAALKYNLFIFYQKGLLTRFLFYLTNLSCATLVVYLGAMAALGWRECKAGQLDRRRAWGWSGWLLHQLFVMNCCMHPLVAGVFWTCIFRPHHVDTASKAWKEATLHVLPLAVLAMEYIVSNRTFVSRRDWVVPNASLIGYGVWMAVGSLLHPAGGRDGGPWFPYPVFAPSSLEVLLRYAAAIGAVNAVFWALHRAYLWKAGHFDPVNGWLRKPASGSH